MSLALFFAQENDKCHKWDLGLRKDYRRAAKSLSSFLMTKTAACFRR